MPTEPAAALGQARLAANRASVTARVNVRTVNTPGELQVIAELFAEIWVTPTDAPPVPADLLRSIDHSGGAVHVAYSDAGLAGAAVAWFGPPGSGSVYSLIAGARASGRGIGLALKHSQRAWALTYGVSTMLWTFDPLVSRNARFNLVKLGAVAREYSVDFYGELADGVNLEAQTDRLTAAWSLTDPRPPQGDGLAGPPDVSEMGRVVASAPDGGVLAIADDGGLWCRVPRDIVALRAADRAAGDAWRIAVREVFVPAFDSGLVATAMTRDGWYRLRKEEAT